MASAAYYKAGSRPWKLAGVRPGVCYLGLVFKNDEKNVDQSAACCAAQMFLDSGDGSFSRVRVFGENTRAVVSGVYTYVIFHSKLLGGYITRRNYSIHPHLFSEAA